jgi:predicted esterase
MAYRAAAHLRAAGVIVLAADVPADVTTPGTVPHVLIGRGRADAWYGEDKMTDDLDRLRQLGTAVDTCVFDGGHEWTDEFAAAAGEFLKRLRP